MFHITAVANIRSICTAGALLAKNVGTAAGLSPNNIAYQGAQGARARRPVPDPPGGFIHDYVPFYFAPRSPMLYTIDRGNVPDCPWRQRDIVHLETSVERVTAGSRFVFFDRNATLAFSEPFTDLARLDEAIAWDLLTEAPRLDGYCKFWLSQPGHPRYSDRMERRQAEFLVEHRVPLTAFSRIGVLDAQSQADVRDILRETGTVLPVEVRTAWYF